jgi:hypothetical protein
VRHRHVTRQSEEIATHEVNVICGPTADVSTITARQTARASNSNVSAPVLAGPSWA